MCMTHHHIVVSLHEDHVCSAALSTEGMTNLDWIDAGRVGEQLALLHIKALLCHSCGHDNVQLSCPQLLQNSMLFLHPTTTFSALLQTHD